MVSPHSAAPDGDVIALDHLAHRLEFLRADLGPHLAGALVEHLEPPGDRGHHRVQHLLDQVAGLAQVGVLLELEMMADRGHGVDAGGQVGLQPVDAMAEIAQRHEGVAVIFKETRHVEDPDIQALGHGFQPLAGLLDVGIAEQLEQVVIGVDLDVFVGIDHGHQRAGEHDHVLGEFLGLVGRQLERVEVVDRNAMLAQRDAQRIDVVAGQQGQPAQHRQVGMDVVGGPAEHGRQHLDADLARTGLGVVEDLDHALNAHVLDQPRTLQGRRFQRYDRQRQNEHGIHVAVGDRLQAGFFLCHKNPTAASAQPGLAVACGKSQPPSSGPASAASSALPVTNGDNARLN